MVLGGWRERRALPPTAGKPAVAAFGYGGFFFVQASVGTSLSAPAKHQQTYIWLTIILPRVHASMQARARTWGRLCRSCHTTIRTRGRYAAMVSGVEMDGVERSISSKTNDVGTEIIQCVMTVAQRTAHRTAAVGLALHYPALHLPAPTAMGGKPIFPASCHIYGVRLVSFLGCSFFFL